MKRLILFRAAVIAAALAVSAPVLTACGTLGLGVSTPAQLAQDAVAAETTVQALAMALGGASPRVRQAYSALLVLRRGYDLKLAGQPLDPAVAAARAATDALMTASG